MQTGRKQSWVGRRQCCLSNPCPTTQEQPGAGLGKVQPPAVSASGLWENAEIRGLSLLPSRRLEPPRHSASRVGKLCLHGSWLRGCCPRAETWAGRARGEADGRLHATGRSRIRVWATAGARSQPRCVYRQPGTWGRTPCSSRLAAAGGLLAQGPLLGPAGSVQATVPSLQEQVQGWSRRGAEVREAPVRSAQRGGCHFLREHSWQAALRRNPKQEAATRAS